MPSKFIPTDAHRNVARAGARIGQTHDEICKLIINPETQKPISRQTLENEFSAELREGAAEANQAVGNALYSAAMSGDTTAAIWWTKARMKWSGPPAQSVVHVKRVEDMTEAELMQVAGIDSDIADLTPEGSA